MVIGPVLGVDLTADFPGFARKALLLKDQFPSSYDFEWGFCKVGTIASRPHLCY